MAHGDGLSRLLFEREPHSGPWNMAYDEALLEAAAQRNDTILRIFRWSEPTLSLGYFQKTLPADLPRELRELPRVRRLSGGGAILHHQEWTYSCAIPKSHPFAQRTEVLYEQAHAALIQAFQQSGVIAELRGHESGDEPFLCFLRGDPRDIVVAGHKIVGSAQRRRRGAILQHGSVLLRQSSLTPEVPGLHELVKGLPEDPWFAATEFVQMFGNVLFNNPPCDVEHSDDVAFALRRAFDYTVD